MKVTKVLLLLLCLPHKILYHSIRLICVVLTHIHLSQMVQYLLSYL